MVEANVASSSGAFCIRAFSVIASYSAGQKLMVVPLCGQPFLLYYGMGVNFSKDSNMSDQKIKGWSIKRLEYGRQKTYKLAGYKHRIVVYNGPIHGTQPAIYTV